MAVSFASTNDLADQEPEVVELAPDVYGFLSVSDPNCGFIVGDDCVLAIDTRATPALARNYLQAIRTVTDKPVRYVFLTHYHAVRVMGASAFTDAAVISSQATADLVGERGQGDFECEALRMPRLFKGVEEVPGLTIPDIRFQGSLSLRLGRHDVQLIHLGRAHTAGDSVCYLPKAGILFGGDIVENHCGIYCGDAYVREWPVTLERLRTLRPQILVPGRGAALHGDQAVSDTVDSHKDFLLSLISTVQAGLARGLDLRGCYRLAEEQITPRFGDWPVYSHVLPFDVARTYDELRGFEHPRIWTPERDKALWDLVHS